ncbi:hypothetical protein [Lysinibacillus fusiformis]|uniref:hypothetical protein n=1 Tax=Lysinibacillus fusiformis TaxID=28031 RepID=UPI0035C0A673|nr:hypothetical protein QYY55_15930 [Lysinibacillus fusiformis]
MIDISAHITSILAPLNLKVYFNSVPTGSTIPDQYITFLEIIDSAALEVGDVEVETKRLIQVNIWSKSNYDTLVKQVRNLFESEGFERINGMDAPKQEGDSHFNKVLGFVFFDEY